MLCMAAPSSVAHWSKDGLQFNVIDPERFEALLKDYFGGLPQTFLRQLHFYGFVRVDSLSGGGNGTAGTWSFKHQHFVRDDPSRLFLIKRYSRASQREHEEPSEEEEEARVVGLEQKVVVLQNMVDDLTRKVQSLELELSQAKSESIISTQEQQQPVDSLPSQTFKPKSTTPAPISKSRSRKRTKEIDDSMSLDSFDFSIEPADVDWDTIFSDLEPLNLDKDDSDGMFDAAFPAAAPAQPQPPLPDDSKRQAQLLLSSVVANPFLMHQVMQMHKDSAANNTVAHNNLMTDTMRSTSVC